MLFRDGARVDDDFGFAVMKMGVPVISQQDLLELARAERDSLHLRARQNPVWEKAVFLANDVVYSLSRGNRRKAMRAARTLVREWTRLYKAGY